MADGKKSFVLYCDQIHAFETLEDDEAGRLIKHIFRYVNDQNPEAPDRITKISFEPIKHQLKRDLKKWDEIIIEKKKAGHLGGVKSGESRRKQSEANEADASKSKQPQANEPVNDNVTVNEISNILKLIRETIKVEKGGEDKFIAMIVLRMIEVFKRAFPKYPVNENFDYPACLQLAYKIAEMKKWKKSEVVNGKLDECLESWKIIVEFITKDEWLCTRSIPDINSEKEWPRLVQKMSKSKKKPEEEKSTAPPLTVLKH